MQLNQLNQLIHHAMAMNPGSRYPTVAEFAADLKKVIAALPSPASAPPAILQPDLPQLDEALQAAKEQQRAEARSALRCPRCGWELPHSARFCSHCGSSLSVPN